MVSAKQLLSPNSTRVAHPFYPLEAEIVGYLANDWDVPTLLGLFAAGWVVILGLTRTGVRLFNPNLAPTEVLCLLWFVLTGTIHFFFEGYFAFNHYRMPGQNDFFGQLWKEYALSDSRYLTSDPFVLCMETVTAMMWGPLAFIVAYMITVEHPLRHPLQGLVCIGQIYGLILYYATSMFDHYYKGLTYCRPERYYFWIYYFFMNFIWMVIPGYYLYRSFKITADTFRKMSKLEASSKANGTAKTNGTAKKNR